MLGGAQLQLKIFLDDKSFNSLKQSIPTGSHSKLIIESAVQFERFGSNAVLTCDLAWWRGLFAIISLNFLKA